MSKIFSSTSDDYASCPPFIADYLADGDVQAVTTSSQAQGRAGFHLGSLRRFWAIDDATGRLVAADPAIAPFDPDSAPYNGSGGPSKADVASALKQLDKEMNSPEFRKALDLDA